MTIEAFAPAKINLTLHVTGQRADGYHLLESLVAFADTGDRLWLDPGDYMKLEVCGPFACGVPCDPSNLVWKAADMARWCGTVSLEKNLPHGAGIGGGSADAAAVLRALGHEGSGQTLGADVPVCVASSATRMSGIGEDLVAVPDMPALPVLLVNPGAHVPTPAVFSGLKTKDNPAMTPMPKTQDPADWHAWLREQRNDLQEPAARIAPEITDVLDALSQTRDCRIVRMSGSGATCFAIYPDLKAAQFAAYQIGTEHPDWWCVPSTLS